jgi:hypothetical protein
MVNILPIPQTFPLVDKDGFYTTYFKRFLDDLLTRVGGITGGTYNQLKASSAALVWDLANYPVGFIILTDPTTTISIVNQVAGAPLYRLTLIQDATGNRTVTWGGNFKFPSAVPPTLSTGANSVDDIVFASDGTNMKYQYSVKDIR